MDRLFSFALHDLRLSEGRKVITIIEGLRKRLQIPLTIHLVFDEDLETHPDLLVYLQDQVQTGNLEIVFHGLKHSCSKYVSKLWAFFHKYQAEYLDNDVEHREATRNSFTDIAKKLKMNLGICPPCWLATKKNHELFYSLHPLYVENLLYVNNQAKKIISPVISLGSSKRIELFFLKIVAYVIYVCSSILSLNHVRIAMHVCDLDRGTSRLFFDKIIAKFYRRGFRPVLLRDLED